MSVGCNPKVVTTPAGTITVECEACMTLEFVDRSDAAEAVDRHLQQTIEKLRASVRSGC